MSLEIFARQSLAQFAIIYGEIFEGKAINPSEIETLMWGRMCAKEAGIVKTGLKIPYDNIKRAKVILPYMPDNITYTGCCAIKKNGGLYTPCCGKVAEDTYCKSCSVDKEGEAKEIEFGSTEDRDQNVEDGRFAPITFAEWMKGHKTTLPEVYAKLRDAGIALEIPANELVCRELPKRRKGRPAKSDDSVVDEDSVPKTKAKKAKASPAQSDDEAPKPKAKKVKAPSEDEAPKPKAKKVKAPEPESESEEEAPKPKAKKVKSPEASEDEAPKAKAKKAKSPEDEAPKAKKAKSPEASEDEAPKAKKSPKASPAQSEDEAPKVKKVKEPEPKAKKSPAEDEAPKKAKKAKEPEPKAKTPAEDEAPKAKKSKEPKAKASPAASEDEAPKKAKKAKVPEPEPEPETLEAEEAEEEEFEDQEIEIGDKDYILRNGKFVIDKDDGRIVATVNDEGEPEWVEGEEP